MFSGINVISDLQVLRKTCTVHLFLLKSPSLVQFISAAQSCLFATPCTAAQQASLSFIYYLPEFAQIHIHRVSDAIPPSHPLSFRSPPAFSLFPHVGRDWGQEEKGMTEDEMAGWHH